MSGNVHRVFLGWDQPALESARDFLLKRVRHAELDLSSIIGVVPGGRAGRILLGMLVEAAERRSLLLTPPTLCTPGEVADILVQPAAHPAGPVAVRAAWIQALRLQPPATLAALVPHPPAAANFRALAGFADVLQRCHSELAAELIDFASVPERCHALQESDVQRWTAAAAVQATYARILAEHSLVDPDLERPRLTETSLIEPREVVLVGVTELSATARAALTNENVRVTSLVFAPPDRANAFCELGCVDTAAWVTAGVAIDDANVVFEDHPVDQAHQVLSTIASLDGRHPAHHITIGVPDSDVVPALQRAAANGQLPVRYAAGRTVAASTPWQVLAAVMDYLEERTFAAFHRLVRQPDIEDYLVAQLGPGRDGGEWWLTDMDEYAAASLHGTIDGHWRYCSEQTHRALTSVLAAITSLLEQLGPPAGTRAAQQRPLSTWAQALLKLLGTVYQGVVLNQHDPAQHHTAASLTHLAQALHEASGLQSATSPIHCLPTEAISLILDATGRQAVPEPSSHTVIEMLGWLEVPLDPAPITIITGVNEGCLPAGFGPDQFLPDQVRRALGIAHNASRYARDVYLLNLTIHSRPRTVLICGRRSRTDDPLIPSRLLFACDPALVVDRVHRLIKATNETNEESAATPADVSAPAPQQPASDNFPQSLFDQPREATTTRPRLSAFPDRPIIDVPPVTAMRVTAFKTYLASPYLFYLTHILRLEEVPQPGVELDAMAYGNLLHAVLERFGRSPVKDSAHENKIAEFVLDELSTLARGLFGEPAPTAVWLQLEFARRRLQDFARFQAARRSQGWYIDQVEWQPPGQSAGFDVDGAPFQLRGKIDRVDRHESSGTVAILDYKTAANVPPPHNRNSSESKWRDLQLPLYRHLGASLNLPPDPGLLILGYVAIPAKPGGVSVLPANWAPAALEDADQVARDVIRAVRARAFDDLGDPNENLDGVLAALCGLGFMSSAAPAEEAAP